MALSKKQKRRKPIFCGKCGRTTFADSPDYQWWLVGMKYGTDVVRCPQHITEWTMRTSGLGRGMDAYRFKRLARENDRYDSNMMSLEPLFLDDDI